MIKKKVYHHCQTGPGGRGPLSTALELDLEHFVIVNHKLAKAVIDTAND